MKKYPVFRDEAEFERRMNDSEIGLCEKQADCYNLFPNHHGYCVQDRSGYPDCYVSHEADRKRRENKTNHCNFEGRCWNYSPNKHGACMVEMEDVLECWAEVDETELEEYKEVIDKRMSRFESTFGVE